MAENANSGGRRGFLKRVAVAGSAAGVAATAGGAIAASADTEREVVATPVAPEPTGYRMTPHIEQYYRLARD